MTADERRAKYPESNYDPLPNCKHCSGTGERFIKKLNLTTCCICIFVDHEVCEDVGTQIGQIARRGLTNDNKD